MTGRYHEHCIILPLNFPKPIYYTIYMYRTSMAQGPSDEVPILRLHPHCDDPYQQFLQSSPSHFNKVPSTNFVNMSCLHKVF